MGADRDEDGVEATLLLLSEQVLDLVVLGEDDAQVAQAVDLGDEDLVRRGNPESRTTCTAAATASCTY